MLRRLSLQDKNCARGNIAGTALIAARMASTLRFLVNTSSTQTNWPVSSIGGASAVGSDVSQPPAKPMICPSCRSTIRPPLFARIQTSFAIWASG